jgi:predicted ATPase/DNA-binding SARP family transcriptional activator
MSEGPAERSTSFQVWLLGPLLVSRAGTPLNPSSWPKRSRSLLLLLASAPEQRRVRDELIDLLWPDSLPEQGAGNLRKAVQQLRLGLGQLDPSPLLVERGWVFLNPVYHWEIDLVRFEEVIEREDVMIAQLEEGLALCRGEPLAEERYEDWATRIRERIEREWRAGCLRLAELDRTAGRPEEAVRWLERLYQHDPLDETVLQQVLSALAAMGRRTEGVRLYQQFERRLKEELDLEPAPETVALIARLRTEAVRARPGAAGTALQEGPSAPLIVLPTQPTPFIGREEEVAAVRGLVATPEVRLVTLTGPGGVGKTRIAVQVASTLLDAFSDGVFFCDLSALNDPSLVPSAMADVLGVKEEAGKSVLESLIEHLKDKHLLLVLDNCEPVSEARGEIGRLPDTCRELTVLATSRIPLHLSREREYAVSPLSRYDAVALFVERAGAVRHGFALTSENAVTVAEICARLDGLPLAIKLAAPMVKIFPPQELLQRLSSRLDLLVGGARDLPTRQQTLRATIDWSYRLLTKEEQFLFARLSVFAGGCTLDAAEAVCTSDRDLAIKVLEGVASLVEQSLVQQFEGVANEARFVMLETIREFAFEQLEATEDAGETHANHAEYYAAWAAKGRRRIKGPKQITWLEQLEREHDNLRTALTWSLRQKPHTALRLAAALGPFWFVRGHIVEGRSWLEKALESTPEEPDTWQDRGQRKKYRRVRGMALASLAALVNAQGDFERGRELKEASFRIFPGRTGRRQRARRLHQLAENAYREGDLATAREYEDQAVQLWREIGDRGKIAGCLGYLARVALKQKDYIAARMNWDESLQLAQEIQDKSRIAEALGGLAQVAYAERDLAAARKHHEESLKIRRSLGNESGIVFSLNNLAWIADKDGDLAAARQYQEECVQHCRRIGDKRKLAATLGYLADLASAGGDFERARRHQEECVQLWREIGDQRQLAIPLDDIDFLP